MSGHSHWAGIKHKKAANDAKRGRLWSKLARAVIVAAKSGGGDPSANLSLRYAIDKAKEANMPKDTIEKAIKKGTGDLEGVSFVQILYEGYAPGGVAIMVDALTDNRNRTAPEIKRIFEKRGGSLGAIGCVNWMFEKKGLITVDVVDVDENTLMEIALGSGADDMQTVGDIYEITCESEAYQGLKSAIDESGIKTQIAEISMVPQNTVSIDDEEVAKKILTLMEDLEDHEDVQEVYANFDIAENILKSLG